MLTMATTASQMLRDDQRLRDLHRETKRRRKRYIAKQKKVQHDEERRRMNALKQRRDERNRYLSTFRRNHRNNDFEKKPIRARCKIPPKISKNTSSFIVPVCDQLSSPILCSTNIKRKKAKQIRVSAKQNIHTNHTPDLCEKKTDFESNDKEKEEFEEFEAAVSDKQSIAELDHFEMKHFGIQESTGNKNVLMTKQSNNGYQKLFEQKIEYKKDNLNNGSLYDMNDIDMKTPEDNDSVKINPKNSVDCSKMSFSTIYNSQLLPLQSVSKRNKSRSGSMNKSYGIKLPRLTQSILKEKDRRDAQLHIYSSTKSTFSAPICNRSRRRQTNTIIDDFFTKAADADDDHVFDTHRTSNNTMFLPKINRSKLKPKLNRLNEKSAYSVISPLEMWKGAEDEERKLEKSLMRINETLSNLALNEPNYRLKEKVRKRKHPSYLNETKILNIPRKIKVKKSPTFKSSRRRRKWNI